MSETHAMAALVVVLLLLAAYYAYRQVRTLRATTPFHEMLPDDRQFMRRQAWRRLIGSVMMVVLASMLAGAYVSGLELRANELGDRRVKERADGQPMSEEDKNFSRFYGGFWIATLLVLGGVVALAGVDLLATRRYGLRQLRRIQDDRRAMLQRQLERYRQERLGDTPDEFD